MNIQYYRAMKYSKFYVFAIWAISLTIASSVSFAQSGNFRLGRWTQTHTAILGELTQHYVDTIPIDKIERKAIDAMLAELDPYTIFIPAEENEDLAMMIRRTYGGIGAVIYKPDIQGNVIINEPYENSPAHKYGLQCGDEILEIDSRTVKGLNSQESSDRMRGEAGSEVVFKVKKVHTRDTVEIRVIRENIRIPDIEYYGMLNEDTGYILLTGFTEGIGAEVRKTVASLLSSGMKTLVLDLRDNGGGLLDEAAEIVSIFLPKGSTVVTSKGRDRKSAYTVSTKNAPLDPKLEVIVLVNSASASSSEIVAGALQDMDRATIMGKRTFGKGLVQSIRHLPYGGELKVTTAKYYTPSGRCVQAIDYSHRNEDGSVSHIPDSLTKEFKTANGRSVRDGGGITPDVTIEEKEYSRLTYALMAYGIIDNYVIDYVKRHESIAPAEEFYFGDEDYEDFVNFAKDKEFDYRSGAKALFDSMSKELEKDGLKESLQEQLSLIEKSMEMEKEDYLRLKKEEIIPLIEEEIVVRYYFQRAGVPVRLRYDETLKQALQSERIPKF